MIGGTGEREERRGAIREWWEETRVTSVRIIIKQGQLIAFNLAPNKFSRPRFIWKCVQNRLS